MTESPFTIEPGKHIIAKEKGHQKMRELKLRFSGFKEQVKDMNWDDLVERIVGSSDRSEVAQIKRSIMDRLSVEKLKKELPAVAMMNIKRLHSMRGHLFEYLVRLEMIKDDEDVATADFLLDCMKHPGRLDLYLSSQKNPDHIGVVVDSETGEIQVTGMYEVKLQKITHSGESQIKQFYYNLRLIVANINVMIENGHHSKMKNFPTSKIYLRPIDELYKYVVVGHFQSEEERQWGEGRGKQLMERDWQLRDSVFSVDDVDLMAAFFVEKLEKAKN